MFVSCNCTSSSRSASLTSASVKLQRTFVTETYKSNDYLISENIETVFLKRNSAYSETVKGSCMCLSLKK